MKYILPLIFVLSLFSCQNSNDNTELALGVFTSIKNEGFNDYWYKGVAELNSYKLDQARYGEVHSGEAVMIFVTEELSKSKQVKLDNPSSSPKDAVPVLKLNFTRKFFTGIYPYSMMTSVFTPVNVKQENHSLKVTTTSQEWCGHTFSQLNLSGDSYKGKLYSYFESEGDASIKIDNDLLEDEIWTRIRIDPRSLPKGKQKIIPGTMYTRLAHIPIKAYEAELTLNESETKGLMDYTIHYPVLNRKLSISFQKSFPHVIESFEENYKSGFGAKAKVLTTKATRKKTLLQDYWRKHSVADAELRAMLDLTNGN